MLSGLVAHAANIDKDTVARTNLRFDFIDMIFLIKIPIRWEL